MTADVRGLTVKLRPGFSATRFSQRPLQGRKVGYVLDRALVFCTFFAFFIHNGEFHQQGTINLSQSSRTGALGHRDRGPVFHCHPRSWFVREYLI